MDDSPINDNIDENIDNDNNLDNDENGDNDDFTMPHDNDEFSIHDDNDDFAIPDENNDNNNDVHGQMKKNSFYLSLTMNLILKTMNLIMIKNPKRMERKLNGFCLFKPCATCGPIGRCWNGKWEKMPNFVKKTQMF